LSVVKNTCAGSEAACDIPALSPTILEALPIPLFLVDRDVRLRWANRSARETIGRLRTYRDLGKSGEVLGCIHALETPQGCGGSAACADCVLRRAVGQAFEGQQVHQEKTTLHVQTPEGCKDTHLLVTATPMPEVERDLVLLCLQDISELIRLRSLIPICSSCKKVRNDDSYWQTLETHFRERLDIEFSHGICPECMAALYPELGNQVTR
jgi:hypothetical protein